ncbi:MAG TPA: BadF/BadG/BcrA/BcrD ATPase family protein [Longimicrobiales bacterium]|nr:BadF/BadG/BcrA/BcrD ATPase family protein [Longimicrobiales bacterium]
MLAFGIDGGGTRSTLVALDATGAIRLRLEGGPLLLDPADPAARAEPIAALARDAAGRLGETLPVAALCCAVAGAGRVQARDALAAAVAALAPARHLLVVTDAEAAFQDAFDDGPGVLVIAGTGSVVHARTMTGEMLRVGGWGELLGDEGSGYAIGSAVLRAVARGVDGRSLDRSLIEPVLAATGCDTPEQLIRWAHRASKAGVASLAQLAFAHPGAAANAIVAQAAADLAALVSAALARGAWSEIVPLACTGGLIAPGRPLRAPLLQALAALPVRFEVRKQPVDGAHGAARLAQRVAADATGE